MYVQTYQQTYLRIHVRIHEYSLSLYLRVSLYLSLSLSLSVYICPPLFCLHVFFSLTHTYCMIWHHDLPKPKNMKWPSSPALNADEKPGGYRCVCVCIHVYITCRCNDFALLSIAWAAACACLITNNEKNLAERLPSCFPARLPFFALSSPNTIEYTQGLTLVILLF